MERERNDKEKKRLASIKMAVENKKVSCQRMSTSVQVTVHLVGRHGYELIALYTCVGGGVINFAVVWADVVHNPSFLCTTRGSKGGAGRCGELRGERVNTDTVQALLCKSMGDK